MTNITIGNILSDKTLVFDPHPHLHTSIVLPKRKRICALAKKNRIMYIRFNNLVKYRIGEKKLLVFILSLSIGICVLITYLHITEPSSRRVAKNMCSGLSPNQDQILIDFHLSTSAITMPTTILQRTLTVATACQHRIR